MNFNSEKSASLLFVGGATILFALLFSFVSGPGIILAAETSYQGNDAYAMEADFFTNPEAIQEAIKDGIMYPVGYKFQEPPSELGGTIELKPPVPIDKNVKAKGMSGGNMMLMSTYTQGETAPSPEDISRVDNRTDISMSGGAFQYAYPIDLPKGRNDFGPNLTLQYSSQDSDYLSTAGYGWSLNVPYIERKNETGTNKLYQQDVFNSSLSGELATTSVSGVYAAKIDNGAYLEYTFASSTSMWTATDKDGTTYLFGTTTSARQDNVASSTQVFRWMLQEQRDANGNKIIYSYTKDQGQIYLSSIQYVFTAGTPLYSVDLGYASSSAPFTSHSAAFPIITEKHISSISISVGGTAEKRYDLTYTKSLKTNIDLLTEIELVGLSGTSITAPGTFFEYQQDASSGTFANDSGWAASIPNDFYTYYHDGINGPDQETYRRGSLIDMNGDGLADWVQEGTAYLNTGSGWSSTTTWTMPNSGSYDVEYRLADVNGDSLPDVVRSSQTVWSPPWGLPDDVYKEVHINQGDGTWVNSTSTAATIPAYLHTHYHDEINGPSADYVYRGYIVDMNGDGLADWVQGGTVYMNTGSGWSTTTTWTSLPASSYEGSSRLADVNGDNLPDIITSWEMTWNPAWGNPATVYKYVYINQGDGTWVNDAVRAATMPTYFYTHYVDGINGPSQDYYRRVYILDIDGDGLNDWLYGGVAYLNTGTDWTATSTWTGIQSTSYSANYRIGDVNGDNLPDIVNSWTMIWSPPWGHADDVYREVYLNQESKPFVLASTTNQFGGRTNIEYTYSAMPVSGTLLNPELPMSLQVVKKITEIGDATNAYWETAYKFEGGDLYYDSADVFDRRFAGFEKITTEDSIGKITSYFHQGNTSATSTNGEYDDTESKIGKKYRQDELSTSGSLYSSARSYWDIYNRGGDANFAKLATSTSLTYDGDAGHRDVAKTYTYDNATGNVTQTKDWGEVTAALDGTFTDTGSDIFTTDISYAASSTSQLSLPSVVTVTDQSSAKIRESKSYYDGLSLGSTSAGNRTRQDAWIDGSNYSQSNWTYNSYGLPLTEIDPRGATTTLSYDAYSLYPSTITNALGHVTAASYDYSSGKVASTTDVNGLDHVSIYDSLDRILEQKEPDLTTPSTLVTKTAYSYTDGPPASITRTDYLDGSVSVPTITFLDGFGRNTHVRKRAEASNTYKGSNTMYDVRGNIAAESLPYFSTGTSKVSLSITSPLWKKNLYDPSNRLLSVNTAFGTTTYAYNDWTATTTDAEGNVKGLAYDAYGNLVQVTEKNSSNYYVTNYEWNGNQDLTRITDADGNLRNFTYDGLSRRLSAEDLHASGDSSHGTSTYAYDAAGNRTQRVTPRGKVIDYTYDTLNRVLTEDSSDTGYTDILYGYDNSVHYGTGKLSGVSTAYNGSGYDYNSNGGLSAEQHVIPGTATTTTFYTYDRQGNVTYITYPDSSYVYYGYNAAGLVDNVQQLESGGPSWNVLVYNYDYSPVDQITLAQYGNSTVLSNTFDANELYRLYSKVAYNSSAYFQYLVYDYDDVGNITMLYDLASTDAAKTMYYGYDDLYRLTSASSTSAANGQNFSHAFAYDPIGNLTSHAGTSYSYDGSSGSNYANPHAATSVGAATHTYDASGNLLTDGTLSNTWNYKEQLTQTIAGATTTDYTYTHNGARVSKSDGVVTTFYPNKYYDITAGGGVKNKYVYANGELLSTIKTASGTTTINYIHPDHLGSTHVVTGSDSTVKHLLDYYPFGSKRISQVSGIDEQHKYIGQYYDSSSDLSYLNARYYDGGRGQFLSQDPVFWEVGQTDDGKMTLMNPQIQNSYSYAGNNPIIYKDPEGRLLQLIPVILFAYGAANMGIDSYTYTLTNTNVTIPGTNYRIGYKDQFSPEEQGSARAQVFINGLTSAAGFGLLKPAATTLEGLTATLDVLDQYLSKPIYRKYNESREKQQNGNSPKNNNTSKTQSWNKNGQIGYSASAVQKQIDSVKAQIKQIQNQYKKNR